MSKTASDAPIKFAQPSVVKALFLANNKAKEETSSIAGSYGDRVKTQIEVGNLHGPAFRQAAAIYRKGRSNELKAKEHLSHLRFYLELLDEEFENKGHTGDLDRMSKAAAEKGAEDEGRADEGQGGETDLNAAPTAEGGVPLGDAQKQFEATAEIAKNRKRAAQALDIPKLDPEQSADKPKRGRKPKAQAATGSVADKYVAEQSERLGPVEVEPASPPPPPSLDDEFEEDIRPEFMKRAERERDADKSSVH